MSRGVWFVAGAGASVWAMVRARRAAEAFTPEGFADRLAALRTGWDLFAHEVEQGRREKETELRERLLVGVDGPAQLPAGGKHRAPATQHETAAGDTGQQDAHEEREDGHAVDDQPHPG